MATKKEKILTEESILAEATSLKESIYKLREEEKDLAREVFYKIIAYIKNNLLEQFDLDLRNEKYFVVINDISREGEIELDVHDFSESVKCKLEDVEANCDPLENFYWQTIRKNTQIELRPMALFELLNLLKNAGFKILYSETISCTSLYLIFEV